MTVSKFKTTLAALLTLSFTWPAAIAAGLDPSVIDPVGKLSEISNSVAQSTKELEKVGDELDKLNKDLDGLGKKSHKDKKPTQKDFMVMEHRYHQTIQHSEDIEKRIALTLGQNLKDIQAVRSALKKIESERLHAKNTKRILSDKDLRECLVDLDDLEKTVKQLQDSLKDEEEPESNHK